MGRFLTLFLFSLLAIFPAKAESIVLSSSDPTVWIHSNFTGQPVTLFGNIEADTSGKQPSGVYDLIMIVQGPSADRVVREKVRKAGLMVNGDSAVFEQVPSYYRVLSSRPITSIIDPNEVARRHLSAYDLVAEGLTRTTGEDAVFIEQFVRLMEKQNLYYTNERGVSFLSPTFFSARVNLPANVPTGPFLAHSMVVQDGKIVAEHTQRFVVRKQGFEKFLGDAARQQPLLYGLVCVILALFTGWLGGVVFRR